MAPLPIKPVIPRRRAANNAAPTGMTQLMSAQQMVPSSSSMMTHDTTSSDVMSLRSPSPLQSSATHTPVTTPVPHSIDIKPNIQNLNLPQYNGSLVPNIPNMEIATLFFNQGFTQQNHHNN